MSGAAKPLFVDKCTCGSLDARSARYGHAHLAWCRAAPAKLGGVDAHQPAPAKNAGPAMQDLVVADIEARKAVGLERYGTLLQGFNGRDALLDAYQEVLDLAVYLRQVIYERDNKEGK